MELNHADALIISNGNTELTEMWTAHIESENFILEALFKQRDGEPLSEVVKSLDSATIALSEAKTKLQSFRNSLIIPTSAKA